MWLRMANASLPSARVEIVQCGEPADGVDDIHTIRHSHGPRASRYPVLVFTPRGLSRYTKNSRK